MITINHFLLNCKIHVTCTDHKWKLRIFKEYRWFNSIRNQRFYLFERNSQIHNYKLCNVFNVTTKWKNDIRFSEGQEIKSKLMFPTNLIQSVHIDTDFRIVEHKRTNRAQLIIYHLAHFHLCNFSKFRGWYIDTV